MFISSDSKHDSSRIHEWYRPTPDGERVHNIIPFDPYFLTTEIPVKHPRINYVENSFLKPYVGNKQLYKIVTKLPEDVKQVRERTDDNYEDNVLFASRYLIDTYLNKEYPKHYNQRFSFDIESNNRRPISQHLAGRAEVISFGFIPPNGDNWVYLLAPPNYYLEPKTYKIYLSIIKEYVYVQVFNSEKFMFKQFFRTIVEEDPDVFVHWHGDNYDFPTIFARAKVLGIDYRMISPIRQVRVRDKIDKKSGQRIDKEIQIAGRSSFDGLKAYRKMMIMEGQVRRYSLDDVSRDENLKHQKLHKSKSVIELWESPEKEDILELIAYNIQDVLATNEIIDKYNLIAHHEEMKRFCRCQLKDTFYNTRMIDNLLIHRSKQRGFALPSRSKRKDDTSKGAIVLDPEVGRHDYVFGLDVGSMYPSNIMSMNLSPDTYTDNPDKTRPYLTMYLPEKDKNLNFYLDKVGLLPFVSHDMHVVRKDIRELMMRVAKGSTKHKSLDLQQYAVKVAMNSVYGALGFDTFRLMSVPVADATTLLGRITIDWIGEEAPKLLKMLQELLPDAMILDIIALYGDSVTGDTPLLLKINNRISIKTINSIGRGWKQDGDKEYAKINAQVWTEKGWTKISNIMRHKTKKKIYRVLTHTGVVDATEDHSLLSENGDKLCPSEDLMDTKLLHSFPEDYSNTETMGEDKAWSLGFFMADGSCGIYNCPSGKKHSWYIGKDLTSVEYALPIISRAENMNFKVLDVMSSSQVHRIVPVGNVKPLVKKYRELCYDMYGYKKVPDIILNSNETIRRAFFNGYYFGDGDKSKTTRCDIKGKIGAMGLYYITRSLGYNVSINTRNDKPDIYRLNLTNSDQRKNPNVVKKVIDMGETDDYVYDLTTENHHFHAGVGQMIVHNTDSGYIKIVFGVPPTAKTIETCGMILAEELNNTFDDMFREHVTLHDPTTMTDTPFEVSHPIYQNYFQHVRLYEGQMHRLSLEFESVFRRLVFMEAKSGRGAKKRYFGMKIWSNKVSGGWYYYDEGGTPNLEKGEIEIKGLERSDNSIFGVDLVSNVIAKVLDLEDATNVYQYLEEQRLVFLGEDEHNIAIYVPLNKSPQAYPNRPSKRGFINMSKYLGRMPQIGERYAMWYVSDTPKGIPPRDVICSGEWEEIPAGWIIDYEKHWDSIRNVLSPILTPLGIPSVDKGSEGII